MLNEKFHALIRVSVFLCVFMQSFSMFTWLLFQYNRKNMIFLGMYAMFVQSSWMSSVVVLMAIESNKQGS